MATCYQLSFHYDPAAATWSPLLADPCRLETVDGPSDQGGESLLDDDDEWFRDKDRSFDDLIIGSITIGIGGPTVGGTGVVGGTGNAVGGTTVGIGGNTVGGAPVAQTGGGVQQAAPVVQAGVQQAAPVVQAGGGVQQAAPVLQAGGGVQQAAPVLQAGGSGAAAVADTAIPGLGAGLDLAPCATTGTTADSGAGTEYDRGFVDGWTARGEEAGADSTEYTEESDEWPIGGADEPESAASEDVDGPVL